MAVAPSAFLKKVGRFFIQDLETYKPASSTVWRILREHFTIATRSGERALFEMHHWLIQRAWYEGKNAISVPLVRETLRRLGNAGWNLIPLPSTINNALGKSLPATFALAQKIATASHENIHWALDQLAQPFRQPAVAAEK